jgi:Uma2 family endonuclease
VDDLRDPHIAPLWEAGHYEIVEGVLTVMPPAYFDASHAVGRLVRVVEQHLERTGTPGEFSYEVDLVISPQRVARVDVVFTTPQDLTRQREVNAESGEPELTYGRLLVPPTLIVECVSKGHERHDRVTKRRWYEEFGVPNYWVFDAYQRRLECLMMRSGRYEVDVVGQGDDELRPQLFGGLILPLARLWA